MAWITLSVALSVADTILLVAEILVVAYILFKVDMITSAMDSDHFCSG